MEKISTMVDMKRTPKEKADVAGSGQMVSPSIDNVPDYPWGLSISLSEEELDKLGLGSEGLGVGDILHMHALMKVTSVSSSENENTGKCCRVELQITHLSGESEDDENEEAEVEMKRVPHEKRRARLYRG